MHADVPDVRADLQLSQERRREQEARLCDIRREFEQTRGVTLLRMDLLTLESLRANPRKAIVGASISADGFWHLEAKEIE